MSHLIQSRNQGGSCVTVHKPGPFVGGALEVGGRKGEGGGAADIMQ